MTRDEARRKVEGAVFAFPELSTWSYVNATLDALENAVREECLSAFVACPNCKGVGWTAQATGPHGDAEQVQCECSAIAAAIREVKR